MAHDPQALQQLQDQLLELKNSVPGLHLKRSTAAQSPAAPFPITATAEVAAPPAAERYDVQSFSLSIRLGSGVLGPAAQQQAEQLAEAVEVEVTSAELPAVLRQAMAAELRRLWLASRPAPGALQLAPLWAAAQQQYVHLLSLVPAVLESYQSEDAWGGTVRRWAVLNDQTTVQIDASVHPAPRAAGSKAQAGEPAAAAAAAGGRGAPPQLPRALQAELDLLQKRYGLTQLPVTPADAAAAQLAGLQLAPAAAAGAGGAAASGELVAHFEVSLRPTDPAWDPAHPLLLHGWLASRYPAAGSLGLAVSPHQQPPLPPLQRQVLEKLLAAEVASAVGRPSALRCVVRQLENHGGQLWDQAEDIAAEVARRRRQQAAGAQQQAPAPAKQQQRQQEEEEEQGLLAAAGRGGAAGALPHSSSSSSLEGDLDDDGAWAGGYASSSGSEAGSSGDGSAASASDAEEGGEAEEAGATGGGGGGGGHSDAVLPLQLQLEGLELVDCDALELLRLNLQVACSRCRATGDMSFATAAVALPSDARGAGGGHGGGVLAAAAECATCHGAWEVEVAPKLLHERSNVLAHVRASGCAPLDLLPSWLAGQCSRCASSAAFRSVAVGRWNERACSACHTPMRFQFAAALFVPHRAGPARRRGGGGEGGEHGAARSGPASAAAAAAAAAYNGLLQLGQPLPDRGTCKHYRHSYRWLRFPCCGRRFPCDLCHEEASDHDLKWAKSMVCGYCSLEQAVAPQCKGCGKKLAATAAAPTGRQTRFWEGGKGQRDPKRLDRRDARRYKGRHKTQSAKHKRVGQGAKEQKERRDRD